MSGAMNDEGKPACVDAHGSQVVQEYGQTQVCFCKPGGRAEWAHPVDVHYTTTSMQGWPKMLLEVWSQVCCINLLLVCEVLREIIHN